MAAAFPDHDDDGSGVFEESTPPMMLRTAETLAKKTKQHRVKKPIKKSQVKKSTASEFLAGQRIRIIGNRRSTNKGMFKGYIGTILTEGHDHVWVNLDASGSIVHIPKWCVVDINNAEIARMRGKGIGFLCESLEKIMLEPCTVEQYRSSDLDDIMSF